MQRGGRRATWLVAMARAQAEWANADERLVERWIGDVLRGGPERAERARRLLAAMGAKRPGACCRPWRTCSPAPGGRGPGPQARRLPSCRGPSPAPTRTADRRDAPAAAPQPPAQEAATRRSPRPGRIDAAVIEVPTAESCRPRRPTGAGTARARGHRGATARASRHVPGRDRSVFASVAAALPEARVRPSVPGQRPPRPRPRPRPGRGRRRAVPEPAPGEPRARGPSRRTRCRAACGVARAAPPGDDVDACGDRGALPSRCPTRCRPSRCARRPDVEPLELDRPGVGDRLPAAAHHARPRRRTRSSRSSRASCPTR